MIGSGWYVCVSKPQRIVCVSFSWTDLFVWSDSKFLHKFPVDHLPTQSCLVLYSYCANLQHSIIMWLIVSSLSLHKLHLLFSCVLSILALTYEVHTISFQTFFVWAFRIVIDSWKFSMLLLYISWDDRPISMISGSNEQLQQQLKYTLLKPDCHSWWISKMQSDSLEERYARKFCFKLGKNDTENVWNASDCFSTILHESSIGFWVA